MYRYEVDKMRQEDYSKDWVSGCMEPTVITEGVICDFERRR